jgi:hypothetical protein
MFNIELKVPQLDINDETLIFSTELNSGDYVKKIKK